MAKANESRSSSPLSPPQTLSDTAVEPAPQRPRFLAPGDVVNNIQPPQAVKDVATNAKASTAATSHDAATAAPAPKRRVTKKKDAENKAEEKPKEKKTRKPRTVDPNKPTAASRKRQKTSDVSHDTVTVAPTRQPTLNEMVTQFQTPMPPTQVTTQPQLHPSQILREDLSSKLVPPPPSRPASSGQRYDPIRAAMTMDPYPSAPPPQASPHVHRASASPAISSLMNPSTSSSTITMQSPVQSMQAPPKRPTIPTAPSPIPQKADMPPVPVNSATNSLGMKFEPLCDVPKNVEVNDAAQVKEKQAPKTATVAKAKRATPPPARPTGSGLLSNSDLFGGPAAGEDDRTRHGVNIDIQIKLNPEGNNTINIAQEIMKKYGRDAINPRAAAHRERLLQVSNMANRIENGSADGAMSEDLNSDLENDSNVEMGGMDDDSSKKSVDGDSEKKIIRRRKKTEEYDKDDDFIDDTELAWQEGAAVAKDGFFVYSGPLVPVGEEAKIETTAPSGKGRGRGRGRARGAAATGVTHAQLAAKNDTAAAAPAASGRGRGRGRGTGAPRKPRITKADRERLENEKSERERQAAAMTQGSSKFLIPQNV